MSDEVPANRLMTGQPVNSVFNFRKLATITLSFFSIYDLSVVPLVNFDTAHPLVYIAEHGREVSLTWPLAGINVAARSLPRERRHFSWIRVRRSVEGALCSM